MVSIPNLRTPVAPGSTVGGCLLINSIKAEIAARLTNAGFPQFIAADLDQYVELAVAWAVRLGELAAIRATLRDRMRVSPLCDAPRFARDFETVIEEAWANLEEK